MGKKRKEIEIPKPLLCRHCKKCGEWFIATHPKDTQEYCERCSKGITLSKEEAREVMEILQKYFEKDGDK